MPAQQGRVFVPENLRIESQELTTGERLADFGLNVYFNKIMSGYRVKNVDITIEGVLWEIKGPRGHGASTVSNQLRRAKQQGSRHLVIDLARSSLEVLHVRDELMRRMNASGWFIEIILIGQDRSAVRLYRD